MAYRFADGRLATRDEMDAVARGFGFRDLSEMERIFRARDQARHPELRRKGAA